MGSRSMDKLDFCLIPFIHFFRLTLTILSVAILFLPTPSTVGRSLNNSLTWTAVFSLHAILFVLSVIHSLYQIPIIQIPLNKVQKLSIVRICLYSPRFYFGLLKHRRNGRSIWYIVTNLVPPEGRPKYCKPSNKIFV